MIRCDHCGMAYDGGKYDNCPHCLAPRPDVAHDDGESIVFYADGEEFCEARADEMGTRIFLSDPTVPPEKTRETRRRWAEDRMLTTLLRESGLHGTNSNAVFPPMPCFRCMAHVNERGELYGTATLFCGFLDRRPRRAFEKALDKVGTWSGSPECGYRITDFRFEHMNPYLPRFVSEDMAITVNDDI